MLQEIDSSIWQIKSDLPGPSICIFGGIHGNEKTGILVIKTLRDFFSENNQTLLRGTLTFGLGNQKAIALNTRGTENRDLNRYFTSTCETDPIDNSYEAQRATLLAPFIRQADITIDLHATTKQSIPFICSVTSPAHERLYRWFGANIVLTDPDFILAGIPCTTDDYAESFGKIGVTYEAGWMEDVSGKDRTLQAIFSILAQEGLIAPIDSLPPALPTKKYQLTEAVILTSDSFSFAPGFGTHTFQNVTPENCIATMDSTPIYPKEKSVIIFPKIPALWIIGKPVCYLAREIK